MNLEKTLAQLEKAQLVRYEDGKESTLIFKHVLTQEAAYASLLLRDRKHLHFIVAQVLEQQYASHLDRVAAQLANHFQQAEKSDLAFKYFIIAGDAAARVYANAEAHLQYKQAFRTLFDLSATDERIRREMAALCKLVTVSTIIDTPENNLAWLTQAEALSRLLKERQPDDQQLLAQINFWRGFLNMIRGELELSNTAYQQTIDLAENCNDSQLVANASFDMGINLNFQGRFGQSAEHMTQAIRLLERSGKSLEDVNALAHLGYALVAQGQHAEGFAKLELGLARAQARENPFDIATSMTVMAMAYQMENNLPKMLETTRTVVQIAEKFGSIFWVLAGNAIQAWAHSRQGQHDIALVKLAQVQNLSKQVNMPLFGGGLLNAIETEIAFNAGRWDEALAAAERTVSVVESVDGIYVQAMAQRVWGQALAAIQPARYADAERHLAASLHLFEIGEARLEAARTQMVWGKVLQESGNRDEARAHFVQAAAQFEKSGLAHELAEAQKIISEVANAR
jgi:tetratricopeptide (TPR) repeat protein